MSLMGMNRAFKKHGAIWGGILIVFVVGGIAFTSFGSNPLAGNGGGGGSTMAGPNGSGLSGPDAVSVATVDGKAITKGELDNRINALVRQQAALSGQPAQSPPPEQMNSLRALVLDKFYKQQAAMQIVAKKNNITVSASDITAAREKEWMEGRKQVAQSLGLKETATDSDIDAALANQAPGMSVSRIKNEQIPDEALRTQLTQQALTDFYKKQAQAEAVTGKPSPDDQIQVRHILIKSGQGGLPDAQAKAKAEKLLAEIKADPTKMDALAKANSDDPGSKDKGGFYDWNSAKTYVPEFSKAALAAGVGKVYPQPVKTQFGYHIIKLEGQRPDTDAAAQKKLTDAVAAASPQVALVITDPAVKAAQLQTDAQTEKDPKVRDAKLTEAVSELGKVTKESDPLGAALLQKAAILQQLKKPKEAIAAYEDALKLRNTVETRLALATLYLDEKDNTNAKTQLAEAEKLAIPEIQMQYQYASLLDRAGEKEKSKAAMTKASEMMKVQMQQMQQAQQAQQSPPVTTVPIPAPKASASPVSAASPAPSAAANPPGPAPK